MSRFYSLPVKEIQRITPNSVTVSFEVPETLRDSFRFTAGQYITIEKELNGLALRRSYSICTTPESEELKIGIKKTNDEGFSHFVNHDLRKGDILEVHPPEGRFVFTPDREKKRVVMAFAAGSGITPIMSMMKTLLEEEPQSAFVLVYGNKSPAETMFYEDILHLKKLYPQRLFVYSVYSAAREAEALFGRIDRSVVNYVLKNKHKGEVFDRFYLCGPVAMISHVKEVLQENGIDKDRIFFELFTTPEAEKEVPWPATGKTSVTVVLDDVETSFVMDKKERVLDAALKEGLDAPYSCRGGICSSCMARLTSGEVTMVQNHILTDEELEEGFILTCQSHPVTDHIAVDYDDI